MKQTILSIAKRPGLYKLVSRGKNHLIVETLDGNSRKMPVFNSERVISLNDIAMYSETEDVPLLNVLKSLCDKEEGKKCHLDYKKASGAELREFFAEILPTFDRDRVHDSDIRKLLQWYNILVENGITDFETEVEAEEAETEAETEIAEKEDK